MNPWTQTKGTGQNEKRIMNMLQTFIAAACIATTPALADENRPRARDLGITPGILEPGELNAITDIEGVRVGHTTIREDSRFNTGVTVIIPAPGNLRRDKVPAAVYVANGYGKMAGISQIQELGVLYRQGTREFHPQGKNKRLVGPDTDYINGRSWMQDWEHGCP